MLLANPIYICLVIAFILCLLFLATFFRLFLFILLNSKLKGASKSCYFTLPGCGDFLRVWYLLDCADSDIDKVQGR